jgi:uncharacterized DUF497 family protein
MEYHSTTHPWFWRMKRGDRYHIEEFDDERSDGEERYVTIASHPDERGIVLVISWTDRSTKKVKVTRIISARPATTAEKRQYEKEISNR